MSHSLASFTDVSSKLINLPVQHINQENFTLVKCRLGVSPELSARTKDNLCSPLFWPNLIKIYLPASVESLIFLPRLHEFICKTRGRKNRFCTREPETLAKTEMRLKNSLARQSGSSNNFIGRAASHRRRRSTFRHLIILRLVYTYFRARYFYKLTLPW